MHYILCFVGGFLLTILVQFIVMRTKLDGKIAVYETEEGTYTVLEIPSRMILEKNFVILKIEKRSTH